MTWNEGYVYRERLGTQAAGLTVLEYLSQKYRRFTGSDWRHHVEAGRVQVDGAPVRPDRPLSSGEWLEWHRPPWQEPAAPVTFAVLHEDRSVLAVAKPRGLPCLPGGGFLRNTLLAAVRRYDPEASPLHRLGRATSGIMLFARSPAARVDLTTAWERREVVRVYRALVEGRLAERELTIDSPIGLLPHPLLGRVHAASPLGKWARSRVLLLEEKQGQSIVEVSLVTGRPHQIRVHLSFAGHPLVGDTLYLRGGIPAAGTHALPGDPGYWLHASRVGFRHPESGVWVELDCLPPPVLRTRSELAGAVSNVGPGEEAIRA